MRDGGMAADDELVRRTAAGDRDAFAALYRRHHGSVYRFARLMTGSDVLAEDVVQEVFLALMREAARYDASRASLTTYLFGVARHQTRRRLLRERRFVALDGGASLPAEPATDGTVDADMAQRDEIHRLRRAILSLPSRYREVIVLCELQDVTYVDAARALGCAVGTIRSRLHRARQLLTDKMRRRTAGAGVTAANAMRCAV